MWVEAGGMVPQAARVAHPYGVPVQSCGGFDSVTAKHKAAMRIAHDRRPCNVLHIGDHDPSGIALFNAAAEDVVAFVAGLGGGHVEFVRVAVNPDQAEVHDLPGSAPKATDQRGGFAGLTYQAEALDPADLARYLRQAIEQHTDLTLHADVLEAERRERDELVATVTEMTA